MRMATNRLAFAALLAFLIPTSGDAAPQQRIALTNVQVISPCENRSWGPATIVVHDSLIVTLDSAHKVTIQPDVKGPATLSFRNRGTVRHEVLLFLLNEGRTPGAFLRSTQDERIAMGRAIGAIFAEPGQPAAAQLLVDLARGRSYLFCASSGMPPTNRLVALGMAKALVVK